MSTASTPADQIVAEDWSGQMGERWLAHLAAFESMIQPIGEALLAHAGIEPGERVVDVGCGAGATSIEIARRVAPSGSVLGLDISPALIEAATRRASGTSCRNLAFHCADAAAYRHHGAPFDRLLSRFGLMFFPQPVDAFTNLRRLLRRGARADFSVWAPAADNAWIAEVTAVIGRHVELPPPVPHAPGPFAFDEPAYLSDVLRRAGFASTSVDAWRGLQWVGGGGASPQAAADFVLDALHFGEMLAQADPGARETAHGELIELFVRHGTPEGIAMPAKAYLVTTRA